MMNFFLALLIGLGMYGGIFTITILFKKFIKHLDLKSSFYDWNNVFRAGSFLALYLIFLLIVYLSYERSSVLSIILLALATSLSVIFIPFKEVINKVKNKQFKEINYVKTVGFLGTIVLLILEVTAFSNVSFKKDDQAIEVPFDSALIVQNTGTVNDDSIVFDHQRGYLSFDNTAHEMKAIYFDFSSDDETRIQIDIYASNNGVDYYFYEDYKFNPNYSEFEYFSLEKYQQENYLKFQFVIDETNVYNTSELKPITLHKIVINRAFPFVFNGLRFALMVSGLSLILLVISKGRDLLFKEIDAVKKVEKAILILTGIGLIYLIVNALVCSSTHFVPIDQVSGDSNAIYYQLFDALRKGQLHLDATEGIDKLNALSHPYEPENRNFYYLWDHAYYNGKYYCYYGIAPVLLVMFPFYLLSGLRYVPSVLLVLEIGTLFSILTFLLAITGLIKLMFKKINIPVLVFALIGALFTSLLFSNTIYKVGNYHEGIYRIPYAYGLCFLFLVYLMLFKAYQNSKLRIMYLGFAGLGVVLLMASRPTLIFALIMTIPLLLKIWLEKYPIKQKIIDNIPMVSVVLIGAVFICLYNYLRFDSIFEFGQTYQLTLTDNTKLAYSGKGILPTIGNFYILPPQSTHSQFPFFEYGYKDYFERYHVYNAGSVGLLYFPMLWGVFAMPFVFNKKDDLFLRIMLYISPLFIFVLAFTTYCFAGVCPRYVVELTAIASFFTIIPLLKGFEKLYELNKITAIVSLTVIVLVSSFLGLNLLFGGFDGWKEADQHGLLEILRSIFNHYNI